MLKLTEQILTESESRTEESLSGEQVWSGKRLRRVSWPRDARAQKRMGDLEWQINFAKLQMQRRKSIGEARYQTVKSMCQAAEVELDKLRTALIFG